jgi:ribonuclease E
LHDSTAGVAKDGDTFISVAGAAGMVGKRVKVRITRVLDGAVYAELVGRPGETVLAPITAEALAEKPTRARRSRAAKPKAKAEEPEPVAAEPEPEPVPEEHEAVTEEAAPERQPKRKKTRRGSRGGRKRKKKPAVVAAASDNGEPPEAPVLIHVPDPQLGSAEADGETADGAQPKKKRTRRGSRGGRRRKKPSAAAQTATAESQGADLAAPTSKGRAGSAGAAG